MGIEILMHGQADQAEYHDQRAEDRADAPIQSFRDDAKHENRLQNRFAFSGASMRRGDCFYPLL